MKSLVKIGFYLFLFVSACQGQTAREMFEFTGDLDEDIYSFFIEEEVVVDIMDGVKQDPRQAELGRKMQLALIENYDWFIEYVSSYPEGQQLPYHENFGITESEYREFLGRAESLELISTGKGDLNFEVRDSVILFHSEGKLSVFNGLKINTNKNIIYFKDYELTFEGEIIIDDASNGLRSRWRGYKWTFKSPADLSIGSATDLDHLSAVQVEFTIGQLEREGLIYMEIKERVIENGQNIASIQLPILF